ncbi:MAG: PAS domain S-box protein [Pseudomonadota bacterium]
MPNTVELKEHLSKRAKGATVPIELTLEQRDHALRDAVIDAALDCIVMMDHSGLILEFNPAAERTFGHKREDVIGLELSEVLIPEELREAHRKGLAHYHDTGEGPVIGRRVEVPALHASGERLLVELAISPVQSGDTTHFSAYLRDITEARAQEEKLRLSEQRFQSLFEMSPEPIIVHDLNGRIHAVNERTVELLGRSKEDLLKTPVPMLHPESHHHLARQAIQEVGSQGHTRLQIPFVRADGTLVETEITARQIESEDGTLVHGLVRDMTEQLAHEESLKRAKEAAERANAAKSDFLANMSHEMRTPLNGILGSLAVVERDYLKNKDEEFVKLAESSGETLLMLIQDLLDLSRIEAGELELSPIRFNLKAAGERMHAELEPMARDKGLQLVRQVQTDGLDYFADGRRIRQVFLNLIGNAIKFTDTGSVSTEVWVDEVGGKYTLNGRVTDTGPGIAKEMQSRLFERFRQADSSKRKRYRGAGLGLAICKELVELMSGEIGVESEVGTGSTFWFRVPVERAEPLDATETALKKPKSNKLSGHVLLAEDSNTNAAVAGHMLTKLGLTHERVANGREAFVLARNQNFDAILMDIGMPDVDGLQATRMLRDVGCDTPIIALTAHALEGDRENAIAQGMDAYLTKPLRLPELATQLKEWIAPMPENTVSAGGLDLPAIEELWGDDMETFNEIGQLFLAELEQRLETLDQAEMSMLQRDAHSLKGAAANVGASALSALAAELEGVARDRSAEHVGRLIESIHAEAKTVRTQMLERM